MFNIFQLFPNAFSAISYEFSTTSHELSAISYKYSTIFQLFPINFSISQWLLASFFPFSQPIGWIPFWSI